MPKQQKSKKASTTTPPVVTIMGHVDHGKTTLLDHIRKSSITQKEAGGITQHIGAYQIKHNNQPITFIDTPGHAAFSQMRARGAAVTDIVILVIAADDGVMPQTKESIRHIKQAGVPVIVAINKTDLKNSVPEMVKAQLVEEDIKVEGYDGDVPVVEISAIKGTNVDKLLDTIIALAEIEELTSDPQAPLQTVVIEASLQRNMGPIATLLVKQGTLSPGQELVSVDLTPSITGKVKQLTSDTGQKVKTAPPSMPVVVLGLKDVPPAGTVFTTPDSLETVSQALKSTTPEPTPPKDPEPETESESKPEPEPEPDPATDPDSPEETSEAEAEPEEKPNIKIILIADTHGSLEAIKNNLTEEVEIIKSTTGQVDESDVMLAHTTGAAIIAFHTQISRSARKLAVTEKVPINSYDIIYKLLEDFQSQILKLLEPTIDEEELGVAKIKQVFEIKGDTIAGCVITSGKISLGDKVHLKRNDKIITDATVSSLKQGKVNAKQVEADQECGIVTKPNLKFQPDDYLQAFKKIEE